MRRVFQIIKERRNLKWVYAIYNLSGKCVATRRRLKHAREAVTCLDRGHTPPHEQKQFVVDLVRMRMKHVPENKNPYVIMTYADGYVITSFKARWSAKAWLKEYDMVRKVKLNARTGSEGDKLIDNLLHKWLVSDDSTPYGDLVEEAKRALKAGTHG